MQCEQHLKVIHFHPQLLTLCANDKTWAEGCCHDSSSPATKLVYIFVMHLLFQVVTCQASSSPATKLVYNFVLHLLFSGYYFPWKLFPSNTTGIISLFCTLSFQVVTCHESSSPATRTQNWRCSSTVPSLWTLHTTCTSKNLLIADTTIVSWRAVGLMLNNQPPPLTAPQ